MPALLLMYFIIYPINIIIHELGHAIPALLFTSKQVNIFLGSEKIKFRLSLGRLKVNFSHSLLWTGGYVTYDNNCSRVKNFTIVILGPISTLAFTMISLWLSDIYLESNTLLLTIFLVGIFLFFATMIPIPSIKNDGYLLFQNLFNYNKIMLLKKGLEYYKSNEIEKAEEMYNEIKRSFNSRETKIFGVLIKTHKGELESAILDLNKMKITLPEDKFLLDSKASLYSDLGENEKAEEIRDLLKKRGYVEV